MNGHVNSRLPLWLKIVWTIWLAVWAPLYWKHYGAQNFLYFCDLGNFLIAAGLWMESRLIFSWQAVGLLVLAYLVIVKETLGDDWLTPELFRFGASTLLNDVLMQIVKTIDGNYQAADYFSLP